MVLTTINPDSCVRLLQSCKAQHSILLGKQLHLILLKLGLDSSLFYGNCLLQMYTRCNDDLTDAQHLFDEMPHRNCFSWNSLIDAYSKSGDTECSVKLFNSMPQKNTFSWNAVIAGLTRHGDLEAARRLFEEMPVKDVIVWNSMMHGYVQHGHPQEALDLYKEMNSNHFGHSSPWNDNFVLTTMISACAHHKAYDCGKQIHARILVNKVECDLVLGSALVDMYSKCGDMDNAHGVLDLMPKPDDFSISALISGYANCGRLTDARRLFDSRNNPSVVLWNSLITGYVSINYGEEALKLYKMMRRDKTMADSSTFASVLSVCTSLGMFENGIQLHAHTLKLGVGEDVVVATTLIDLYSKSGIFNDARKVFNELKVHDTVLFNSMINLYSNCGRVQEAREVFETIPYRTLISWNSMIVGYSQNGCAMEALELFSEMHRRDLKMDKVTLASVISACASCCSLGFGEQVFGRATIVGLESDHIISTSLVDLYCKSGNVKDGWRIFDGMIKSDVVLWNSMLMGYATNGRGMEVLNLFEDMRNANVSPNEVTFIAVLSGCCHCGLIDQGWKWFHTMKISYNINVTIEHYSCIVDLLVRAGRLEEAVNFIDTMPFKADASMWTSLMRGCQSQGDESLGSKIAERLMELDPQQSGPYVQLSSIYASQGDWERSVQVRKILREREIKKNPGCSWIDI